MRRAEAVSEAASLRLAPAGAVLFASLLIPCLPASGAEFSAEFTPEMTIVPDAALESCSEMTPTPAWAGADLGVQGITARILTFSGQGRMFGVLPNHRAAQEQATYTPLTNREKYEIARKDSFDWPNFPLLVGYALQSQMASGGFSHNGGFSGFAKFYSRAFSDGVIGNYITEAILPSLFHQDPRFFRIGTGSVLHRAGHAASSIFVARSNDGHLGFNFSEVVGNAGVIAITTAYYPQSQSAGAALERYGMNLGNDMISNMLTEFWPDVKRRMLFLKARMFKHPE